MGVYVHFVKEDGAGIPAEKKEDFEKNLIKLLNAGGFVNLGRVPRSIRIYGTVATAHMMPGKMPGHQSRGCMLNPVWR